MQLAPATAPRTSPLAWFLVETRGPQFSDGDRYSLTTLEMDNDGSGQARLHDGRMTYPRDGGITEFHWESLPVWALPGVDPDTAVGAARHGVELLAAAIDAAGADLERFRVSQNGRHPRNPDTFEIWLRRESGERGRYIVPRGDTPASIRDIQRAAAALGTTLRSNFDRLDPGPGHTP